MKKYKCNNCGAIVETEDSEFSCPSCDSPFDKFDLIDSSIINNDIEAIIDSMIESSEEVQEIKIVNDNIEDKKVRISEYNPSIMRINEKCINCGQCKKTCENIQNIRYDLNVCEEPICVGCGQCILNCPTGALVPKYAYKDVLEIINKNEKIVVALLSPGVKVSLGDSFNLEYGTNVENKIVSALKKIGFDYVFDTSFGADLTVLEEVSELIDRINNKKSMPMFTSCCPAWVKYAEIYHPELLENISTCKSPIAMETAIIKTYFADKKAIDANKIVTVAITPCTSKKMEAKEYVDNIDYVLTANELSLLLKEQDVKLTNLNDDKYDSLLGESTGAGILFASSGGVTEAVLRTLHKVITGKKPDNSFMQLDTIRGLEGIKTASVLIGDRRIKVAIVNGIANLEKLLIEDGYKKFHFIEVMNCSGGCIGGGGQPLSQIIKQDEIKKKRIEGIYELDKNKAKRSSYENEEVKTLYKEFLKVPLNDVCMKLLHTSYSDKSNLLKERND